MENLPRKWNKGELTVDDVKEWIDKNEGQINGSVDKEHVAHCLYSLYLDDKRGRALGGFLSAVKDNDLREAVLRADKDNRKAIVLYPLFIHNVAPMEYSREIR